MEIGNTIHVNTDHVNSDGGTGIIISIYRLSGELVVVSSWDFPKEMGETFVLFCLLLK